MTDAPVKTTLTVMLDGQAIEANPGELVIDAAERHGVYIPRFCYHPRMREVGMCRMCLVDIDAGRGPMLTASCIQPCTEGMTVDTQSERTKKAQDGVLEFLLINHPLDCPVCDKGGECPLQDQTLSFGPGESRFVEEKRHAEKPIPISDLVLLDRERCILCDRCTRFASEVAGDPLIHFVHRGNYTEVNTFPDHPFSSYFSGNTVQLCPVGALTASAYRFKARPWDLEQVESTCTSCSVGCRVAVQSSRNQLLRYLGVDVDPVNWGWLCDKGRFDFEAVNSDLRLPSALVRENGELVSAGWRVALRSAAAALDNARRQAGSDSIALLGGARGTNEDAYAWAKLIKGVLGSDNVDAQLGDGLPADLVLGAPRATIDEAMAAKTVVLLGADLKEELPVLFLRLRDAVTNHGLNVVELSALETGCTPLATLSLRHRPGEVGALARAISTPGDHTVGGIDADAVAAARALIAAGDVVVIAGRHSLSESAASTVEGVSALLDAGAKLLPALRRGNVFGALDMGLTPGLLPGRVTLAAGADRFARDWRKAPSSAGLDAHGILTAAAEGKVHCLVLLGADPLADFPDRDLARRALAGARFVIAVDCFLTESARQADVVLAAAGYAEKSGTTTNLEGRVSWLSQKVTPPGTARADWMLAAELAFRLDADLGFTSVEEIWDEIERLAPAHAGCTGSALRAEAGRDGVIVPVAAPLAPVDEPTSESTGDTPVSIGGSTVEEPADTSETDDADDTDGEPESAPAAPASIPLVTFSAPADPAPVPSPDQYSLRLVATRKLYDGGTLVQQSPSLAGLAPEGQVRLNGADVHRLGLGDTGRVRLTSARAALTLPFVADPTIPAGVAALVFNVGPMGSGAADLIDAGAPVTEIRVETV